MTLDGIARIDEHPVEIKEDRIQLESLHAGGRPRDAGHATLQPGNPRSASIASRAFTSTS